MTCLSVFHQCTPTQMPLIDVFHHSSESGTSRGTQQVGSQPLRGKPLVTSATDLRPIILITGATGNLGRSLGKVFNCEYRTVGLDRATEGADFPVLQVDFTSDASMELALRKFRDEFGTRIASVIHLVAYFDFTGEEN